jgi:DNA polymerase elongation subunit (family B)
MIEGNLSPECLVDDLKYLELIGYTFYEVEYKENGRMIKRYFARKKSGEKGIIPTILDELLTMRKAKKKEMAEAKEKGDNFMEMILDGVQLAYKLTANSIYGQHGNKNSKIRCIPIASCTTAIGRKRLHHAKDTVEAYYHGKDGRCKASVVYGDTDSIFIEFDIETDITTKEGRTKAVAQAIKYGEHSAGLINADIPSPQKIVYEKTFLPLILIEKKKYTGNLFEEDPTKFYQKNMGIVLKRRDNAPIVKMVVGGIVRSLLNDNDPNNAIEHTKKVLKNIVEDNYNINKFIISKTLKGKYKNPLTITHKVLADRMYKRDPGSAPQINDRVSYAHVVVNGKMHKQGEILGNYVEDPDYIKKNNIPLDYSYYITNQIMNPSIDFLQWIHPNPESIFTTFLGDLKRKHSKIANINDFICAYQDNNDSESDVEYSKVKAKPRGGKIKKIKQPTEKISNYFEDDNNFTVSKEKKRIIRKKVVLKKNDAFLDQFLDL